MKRENKKLIIAIQNTEPIVQDYIHEIETAEYSKLIHELFNLRQQRDALVALHKENRMLSNLANA